MSSLSFACGKAHAYTRQSSVYITMIMSFRRKMHGSYFDCLNTSLAHIALNLRNQFCDACTSPYKFRLSFNAHYLCFCSKRAGNQRYMSSLSFACGKACVKSSCLPFRLCIAASVFIIRIVLNCTRGKIICIVYALYLSTAVNA
jgi:hypothetical protein